MLKSLKKNKTGILLMIVSSIFACLGQLFWKMSYEKGIIILLLGFVFYGIGALVMLTAYRHGSLSVLQPILSINYVLSIILAYFILKEQISIGRVLGIMIVIIGVIFISCGDE